MKKIAFLLIFPSICLAQQITLPEPEFVGNVVFVSNNEGVELEKQKVSSRTSASAGLILFGLGSVSSKLIVKGKQSPVRISAGYDLKFIVRVLDNMFDPFDKIEIIKFSSEGQERRLKIASVGTFESPNSGDVYRVRFKAQKYGTSSYLVTIPSISPGEYAFNVNIVSKENNSTGSSTFYLFGIDYNFNTGELVEWIDSKFGGSNTVKMGKVSVVEKNKITVISTEGIAKVLNLNTEEIRKVNPEKIKNLKEFETAAKALQVGDKVQFSDLLGNKWYGTIKNIENNTAHITTTEKGVETTKSAFLSSLKRDNLDETEIDVDKYENKTLWDMISVGDRVEAHDKSQKWIGTYLGVIGNNAYIKTTDNGRVIIKEINYNVTGNVIAKIEDEISNESIKPADIVTWQDTFKKVWEGKVVSIENDMASISLLSNEKTIKKVKIDKLKKK